MGKVSGSQAANRLLALRNIKAGYCLYYVWQSYKAVGAKTSRNAPTAFKAWKQSDGKHKGDKNPPAGVPVWFGKKPSSAAGDVTISVGGGKVAVTSTRTSAKSTGTMTIDARAKQIGRPYLGWTECIFDQPINFTNATVAVVKKSKHPATVRHGDRGATVETLQTILVARNHPMQINRVFGDRTHEVVIAVQRRHALKDDGICGPKTWTVLGH